MTDVVEQTTRRRVGRAAAETPRGWENGGMTTGQLPHDLHDAIVASGYFPEFVAATVRAALGDEPVTASMVHHEATFDRDEIKRHVTVMVLTPTRLIVGHTDDGESPGVSQALTTVETVPLRQLRSVALTQVVANPERYGRGRHTQPIVETWLVVGWGAVRRVEIEPATCGDPECDADHGMTAQDMADDLSVRVSAAADGEETVARLVTFGTALQRATV